MLGLRQPILLAHFSVCTQRKIYGGSCTSLVCKIDIYIYSLINYSVVATLKLNVYEN